MKKILIAALIFAAGIGTSFAQQSSDSQQCPENCPVNCPVNSPDTCPQVKKGPRDGKQAFNPFEGLNLTADQQAKLEALKPERKAVGDKNKADRQKEREDRAEAGKQARVEQLAKIKDILTPEQYLQFLENNFVNAPAPNQGARFGKGGKPGQPGNDIKKAPGVSR